MSEVREWILMAMHNGDFKNEIGPDDVPAGTLVHVRETIKSTAPDHRREIIQKVRDRAAELAATVPIQQLADIKAYRNVEVCALLDEIDRLEYERKTS